MKTANLRFYSPGDDSGGTVQGTAPSTQGDEGKKPETPQDGADGTPEETPSGDRLTRENARRRIENEQLKQQLSELTERLEASESAKLTDGEKLQKEQEKLRKQAAEFERKAQEAERKYHSSRAVLTYKLPDVLSDMLQGATEEEIDEHAKLVSGALEKYYREKFRPTAPDTEGGNRHDKNGANKLTAEQQRQHEIETARTF